MTYRLCEYLGTSAVCVVHDCRNFVGSSIGFHFTNVENAVKACQDVVSLTNLELPLNALPVPLPVVPFYLLVVLQHLHEPLPEQRGLR